MIVGIGEILWDIYPDGHKVAGGAPFNFAFHCRQLGHPAAIVSRVGNDDLGRELRAQVRALGLSDEYIQTDHARPTGTVKVTVDPAGQPVYAIDTNAAWGNLVWLPALGLLSNQTVALCHGTLALRGGPGSRRVIHDLATQVDRNGGLTIYDVNLREKCCESPDEDAIVRSRWLKVNDEEAPVLMRVVGERNKAGNPVKTVPELLQFLRADAVAIVTKGAAGADVFGRDFNYHQEAPQATVVDTVGAGDAFTAAMTCLHLEGRPIRECLRFAAYYAARVCEHQGATPRIDRAAVEAAAVETTI
jgi:fructokinase